MGINEIISGLPDEPITALKNRLSNAHRLLARDPHHEDANRLYSAIVDEFSRRKMAARKQVGVLWWEPHNPDVPEFFAYEAADSKAPVAAIFKSNTHTGTRKEVYSVRIGDYSLPGQFSEVAMARKAGSEAWENGLRP